VIGTTRTWIQKESLLISRALYVLFPANFQCVQGMCRSIRVYYVYPALWSERELLMAKGATHVNIRIVTDRVLTSYNTPGYEEGRRSAWESGSWAENQPMWRISWPLPGLALVEAKPSDQSEALSIRNRGNLADDILTILRHAHTTTTSSIREFSLHNLPGHQPLWTFTLSTVRRAQAPSPEANIRSEHEELGAIKL